MKKEIKLKNFTVKRVSIVTKRIVVSEKILAETEEQAYDKLTARLGNGCSGSSGSAYIERERGECCVVNRDEDILSVDETYTVEELK